jgi:hypothetical protein
VIVIFILRKITRGTRHGQGNFGTVPNRLLLTFTPRAYAEFFMDRVELSKAVNPESPKFTDKINELRRNTQSMSRFQAPGMSKIGGITRSLLMT